MAGWREEYERRRMSFDDAAALIQGGDIVHTPIGGDARSFMSTVLQRIMALDYQVAVHACSPTPAQEWFTDAYASLPFDLRTEIYVGPTGRVALEAKRADFYSNLFSNQFNVWDHRPNEREPIDVFLTQCTAPDADGYVNFGGSPWQKGDFARRARTSIFEVWPFLPNVPTTERMHVTEVTAFVDTLLTEAPPVAGTVPPPEAATIMGFVREIVQDGDTVQIGAGRTATHLVPLGLFEGKHDLGWHSEITPLGVLPLMMAGVVNSSRKSNDRGLHVTTTVSPRTPEEFEWLERSGKIETRAVKDVNSIIEVAKQERMCAINNAFTVDLTGQICSESLGTTTYNGTGGQSEFHIGASLAKGGKAVTVLPSSTKDGTITRIVPAITDGQFVTVPRTFADYVVTEFGIARLAGKSQRQRAEELIAIAHPDHRGELRAQLRSRFYPAPD